MAARQALIVRSPYRKGDLIGRQYHVHQVLGSGDTVMREHAFAAGRVAHIALGCTGGRSADRHRIEVTQS
jgi:hypothetical protein